MTPKIFEQNSILAWSSEVDYPVGSLVKLNGGGLIYASKLASGPSSSAGPKNPSQDTTNTYWTPVSLDDNNVVHKSGTEIISGSKTYTSIVLYLDRRNANRSGAIDYITDTIFSSTPEDFIPATYSFQCFDANISHVWAGLLFRNYISQQSNKYTYALLTVNFPGKDYDETNMRSAVVETNGTISYVRPNVDNDMYLGTNEYRWKQLYAGTTTIATSDKRLKDNIQSIPDQILDGWGEVQWSQFQMKDSIEEKGSDKARLHAGLVAQDIREVFERRDLDISKYGLFCHDEWGERPNDYDENGNLILLGRQAGDIYSLRYEEALCMEAAYQRRENRRLKEKVASLEERLANLESKLN